MVFYDELVSPDILDRIRRDAARVPVGRRVGKPGIGQHAINKRMIEAAQVRPARGAAEGRRSLRVRPRRRRGRSSAPGRCCLFDHPGYHRRPRRRRAFRGAADLSATRRLRIAFLTAHKAGDADPVDWSTLTDTKMTVVVYMGMTAAPASAPACLPPAVRRKRRSACSPASRGPMPKAPRDARDLPDLVGGPRRSGHSHHRRRGRAFRAPSPPNIQHILSDLLDAAE